MAKIPRIAQQMSDEVVEFFNDVTDMSEELDPFNELVELVKLADPADASELEAVFNNYLSKISIDEQFQAVAGQLLASSAMAAAHLDNRLVESWSSVDAIENEKFWQETADVSPEQWVVYTDYAVANSREIGVALVYSAIMRIVALVNLPVGTFKNLVEENPNLGTAMGGAISGVAVLGYSSWSMVSTKLSLTSDNDVIIYIAVTDIKTRSSHAKLNGFSFKRGSEAAKDSRVWAPNGPNCRCTNQVVTGQAATEVVTSETSPFIQTGSEFRLRPGVHPSGVSRDVPRSIRTKVGDPRIRPRTIDLFGEKIDVNAYKASEETMSEYDSLHPDAPSMWSTDWNDTFDQEARDRSGGLTDRLDQRERMAIRNYTYGSDWRWNGILRSGVADRSDPSAIPGIKTAISGLNKLPKHTGIVYRGAGMTAQQLNSYKVGVQLKPKAFTSTSTDIQEAESFAEGVLFEIQSKTGTDVSALSIFENESEILFKPGTVFEVRETFSRGRNQVIVLEEVL